MQDSYTINNEISKYWSYIKNASDEVKLNLISLLSLSLSKKHHNIDLQESNKETTLNFLDKFSGSWHGDETAEEIIESIKSNLSSKEPPILD